ncbi:MAG: hypothetical protein COV59_04760 [Candidatus Magasanikbacteria bacterium CG11_big_fil_rev_8_21_14_0_20_39_34]|uniref:Uncharacterized protein n=1 Tax=Candidatus Magasanikbacteria bacterium CG11_big_fil_rev_8_21_14_0_20_39_34 TaxID=1974653 RepID=A0A2H0N4C0_9BACT|nr:MAG: hypothetical protein COV59_04760 [Candidatus Magasanikbacteria bacterium CG11_big_fil_rev_8_21_14_0_20_39_34]
MSWFKGKSKEAEPQRAPQTEVPRENPYADAPYRGEPIPTVDDITTKYGGFHPEYTRDGMDAVSSAIKFGGEFLIPNPDQNAEDPFFWKGVAERLKTESNFGNAMALKLSQDIEQRVNRALGSIRGDVAKTDGAKVDFSDLPEMISNILKQVDTLAA